MSAPDVAGVVTGWRLWETADREGCIRLTSPIYSAEWPPSAAIAADCGVQFEHAVPDSQCGCGFYATRLPTGLGRGFGSVLGCVALWGEILEGETGWRASRATPRLLIVGPTFDEDDRRRLAETHRLPVYRSTTPVSELIQVAGRCEAVNLRTALDRVRVRSADAVSGEELDLDVHRVLDLTRRVLTGPLSLLRLLAVSVVPPVMAAVLPKAGGWWWVSALGLVTATVALLVPGWRALRGMVTVSFPAGVRRLRAVAVPWAALAVGLPQAILVSPTERWLWPALVMPVAMAGGWLACGVSASRRGIAATGNPGPLPAIAALPVIRRPPSEPVKDMLEKVILHPTDAAGPEANGGPEGWRVWTLDRTSGRPRLSTTRARTDLELEESLTMAIVLGSVVGAEVLSTGARVDDEERPAGRPLLLVVDAAIDDPTRRELAEDYGVPVYATPGRFADLGAVLGFRLRLAGSRLPLFHRLAVGLDVGECAERTHSDAHVRNSLSQVERATTTPSVMCWSVFCLCVVPDAWGLLLHVVWPSIRAGGWPSATAGAGVLVATITAVAVVRHGLPPARGFIWCALGRARMTRWRTAAGVLVVGAVVQAAVVMTGGSLGGLVVLVVVLAWPVAFGILGVVRPHR